VTEEEVSGKLKAAPPGIYHLKVDSQGRLTIPRPWTVFMETTLGSDELFITRDQGYIKIFPMLFWMRQDEIAYQYMSEEEYQSWSLTMQHYGTFGKFDSEGRITLSPTLRNEMNLKGVDLTFFNHRGVLRGLPKTEYDKLQKPAEMALQQKPWQPQPGQPRMA